MIRTLAQPSRSQIFWKAFLIILIAEGITILVAWLSLDHNTKSWLHAKAAQTIQISRWAASTADWSRIDKVPKDKESALGDTYQNRLGDLSDKRFSHKEGSVYVAFLDHGEEYDMYSGSEIPIQDSGKANQWILTAYATRRMTYSPEPIVDDSGTYLAAYTPVLRDGNVIGLVVAEYDEAPMPDFQSIVRTAFLYSIGPALLVSLIVAYILASMFFVEPKDFLRAIDQTAKIQLARSLRGEKDELWDSLTPREMEVAELASEGLQNKEIAERLFISPETIKQHLKSITIKTRWTTRQLGLEAQARRIAQLLRATA